MSFSPLSNVNIMDWDIKLAIICFSDFGVFPIWDSIVVGNDDGQTGAEWG
jgi:hypothetical protein